MPIDMARAAQALSRVFADGGLTHLRVTKRGKTLLVTGSDGDPEARLTSLPADSWRLDLPDGRGRWAETPFVGSLAELVDAALSIGRLQDMGSDADWNWRDTSDPSH